MRTGLRNDGLFVMRHMPNFAKHLPPSAGLPRVLALDESAAAALPVEVEVTFTNQFDMSTGPFDAVVGHSDPDDLARWLDLLRPGGRLILAYNVDSQTALDSMIRAGYVHCLVERDGDLTLYRGERPPIGSPLERISNLQSFNVASHSTPVGQGGSQISNSGNTPPFLHLLVSQTPNRPAWKLELGDKVQWLAASAIDPRIGRPVLLAFGSLVKAVAFMQPALLAKKISGVNKISKFSSAVVQSWNVPFTLNAAFHEWREAVIEFTVEVDPHAAALDEQ